MGGAAGYMFRDRCGIRESGQGRQRDVAQWRQDARPMGDFIHFGDIRQAFFQVEIRADLVQARRGFPEHAPNWEFIFRQTSDIVNERKSDGNAAPVKVLNLFAYTGAASLAAKCAGADVTHLDSVRQVVTWARDNMERSGLDNIRWVVEDALKFVRREVKRGNKYQGIILDPPAYGHGPDGEKWKLDDLLFEMMKNVGMILDRDRSFLLLNLYSNGYSAVLADTIVREALQPGNVRSMDYGELVLRDGFGKNLPLSVFSRVVI